MPPLEFNDRVNVASMIGTWFGSAFTGIGLIAVYSQLQRVLKSPARQKRMLERGAGRWKVCLDEKVVLPERGCVEEAAPAFSGWLQRAYSVQDYRIQLTQYDRGTAGTFNWSRLFAMCEIHASDLLEHGGPDAWVMPIGGFRANRNITQPQKSNLADVRVEDGKLLYGFSSDEFAALLILGGFSPTKVSSKGSVTGFLGRMHIMNHSPFTQIAVFDPHQSVLSMPVQHARYLHTIPVAQCLDLALGIIRTPQRGTRTAIMFPNLIKHEVWKVLIWNNAPSSEPLRIIGDTLQRMTGKFDLAIFTYQTRTKEDHEYVKAFRAGLPEGCRQVIPSFLGELVLHIAHAIDALQP